MGTSRSPDLHGCEAGWVGWYLSFLASLAEASVGERPSRGSGQSAFGCWVPVTLREACNDEEELALWKPVDSVPAGGDHAIEAWRLVQKREERGILTDSAPTARNVCSASIPGSVLTSQATVLSVQSPSGQASAARA